MLTGIGLRNFKAFGDEMQEAPLSKITLIYGPNSGGKSSIIQALLLLKQSLNVRYADANRTLMPRGELVDLGSLEAMLHKHEKHREIFIKFGYQNLEQGNDSARNDVLMTFEGNGTLARVHCRIVLPQRGYYTLLDAEMRRPEESQSQPTRHWNTQLTIGENHVGEVYASNTVFSPGRNESNEFFSNIESFLPCITLLELREVRENVAKAIGEETRVLEEAQSQKRKEATALAEEAERKEEEATALAEEAAKRDEEAVWQMAIQNQEEAMTLFHAATQTIKEATSIARSVTRNLNRGTAVYRASHRAIVTQMEELRRYTMPPESTPQVEQSRLSLGALTLKPEEIIALTPENIPYDYEDHLRSVNYLGSLRSPPKRVYEVSTQQEVSEGVTGMQGEYFANALYHDSSILEQVNEWFEKDKFDISYNLDVVELGDASLAGEHIAIALYPLDKSGNRVMNKMGEEVAVTLADVGYGINQLLPVIIEGIASQGGSMICVEQPEIHLHPRLQANIADLMIDTIADAPGKQKQWIVETHSELLILRLQRRIREGKIKPEDISVLYVDPNDESTEGSAIKVLRLGEDSYFKDPWPDGFFADSLKEQLSPDDDDHGDSDEDADILDKLFSAE